MPPKNTVVDNTINKDVLILVLRKENEQLKELVALQKDKFNRVEEALEAHKEIERIMQKRDENTNQIIKNYEAIVLAMGQQLQKETDHSIELSKQIEEMQAVIDSKTAQ